MVGGKYVLVCQNTRSSNIFLDRFALPPNRIIRADATVPVHPSFFQPSDASALLGLIPSLLAHPSAELDPVGAILLGFAHGSITYEISRTHALTNLWPRARVVPVLFLYFLSIGTRFETHSVNGMGCIKPALSSFSTSALIVSAFLGFIGRRFWHRGFAFT